MIALMSEDRISSKTTKVERYNWKCIDRPGEFRLIHKRILEVDPQYQRTRGEAPILKMAREWSWVSCGAIVVNEREDGALFVIDGQGRKLAADKRADVTELPCLVYHLASVSDEATGFVLINTVRTGMRSMEKFPAEVVRGNPVAIAIKEMVEGDGYRIAASGNFSVQCVGALMRSYAIDEDATRTAWKLCVEIHNGEPILERIFTGIFTVERFLRKANDVKNRSLAEDHNKSSLVAAGKSRIMEKITQMCSVYGGGSTSYGRGIAQTINHKRSSRRISFGESPAESE